MAGKRTLTIAVVDSSDLAHDAVAKFLGTRKKKGFEHVLFIYNIADEELQGSEHVCKFEDIFFEPNRLVVVDGIDLLTRQSYRRDYKTAFADAMIIAQQLVGVDCELPKFYNYYKEPKVTMYSDYKRIVKENE